MRGCTETASGIVTLRGSIAWLLAWMGGTGLPRLDICDSHGGQDVLVWRQQRKRLVRLCDSELWFVAVLSCRRLVAFSSCDLLGHFALLLVPLCALFL